MANKVVGFCVVAAVLGIISAATGFAGELTRVKASEVDIDTELNCVYPSSPALALGIISAVFTIITRIYISASFGGTGCCGSDPNSTPISKLLFVLSWVASVIAVLLLLAAAGLNNREGGQMDSYGSIRCYVVKPGIFAAGAILALLSAVFGIAAHLLFSSAAHEATTKPTYGVPMGANVELPQQYPPQQYPPQHYPPQQYPPQQYPPQQYYSPQQYPPQK